MSSPQKFAIDLLLGSSELLDSNGRSVPAIGNGNKVLVLYFSAHWCPPCRQFTPRLRDIYQSYKSGSGSNNKVQVVFVSADRTVPDMLSYMKEAHGNWPGVPPGSALQQSLSSAFSVQGIPAVIVVDESGEILTRDGRSEVLNLGVSAFKNWEDHCSDVDTSIVLTLRENPPEAMREAGEILIKLIGNVIRDPTNLKFRSVRLSNPKIESKLLTAVGAFEILFSVGFEEGTDSLVLPFNAPLKNLDAFKKAIEDVISGREPELVDKNRQDNGNVASTSASVSAPASSTFSSNVEVTAKSSSSEQEFLAKLKSDLALSMSYEDPAAQAEARKVIPIEKLENLAREKCQNDETLFRDFLLSELTNWFKNDFFTWFDAPKCDTCNTDMRNKGHCSATPQELSDGASVIELFFCEGCGSESRFPRYHSRPVKLLSTRTGRCGEWANCFSLILRSMDFETRRVLDWTDHVWCEVYSASENRWLHVDPCENAIDKPLVYEKGWGKKLTYVIATSKDEVQDVTWRYSSNHVEVRGRRQEVREQWLTQTLLKLSEECQKNFSEDQKKKITERRLLELVELMSTPGKKVSEGELQGRSSGSLAWRLARGEQGATSSEADKGHVWRVTPAEKESKVFHMQYNIVNDKYTRVSNNNDVTKTWQSGAHEFQNIARKEEKDWKMVYLARKEGSEKSSISWTLDLSDTNLTVKSVELDVESSVFESGRIVWQLCGGTICLIPLPGTTLKSDGLSGSKKLTLTALMCGGKGDVAWQHTQLFRSKLDSDKEAQLRIVVKLQGEN